MPTKNCPSNDLLLKVKIFPSRFLLTLFGRLTAVREPANKISLGCNLQAESQRRQDVISNCQESDGGSVWYKKTGYLLSKWQTANGIANGQRQVTSTDQTRPHTSAGRCVIDQN